MHRMLNKILVLILLASCVMPMPFVYAVVDSFRESFDNATDGSTIDGVSSWSVSSGNPTNAIAESQTTPSGSGNALKIANAINPVAVSRAAVYGNLTPAWVEFTVKPSLGNQASDPPQSGIGAVCFNFTGDILAADGPSWIKTGQTFTSDTWYRVLLKIDFTTHMYSIYVTPASISKIPFLPDKENLHFIDASINAISQLGFNGVYNATRAGDTYVDNMVVHFIQRSKIITPTQTIGTGKISNPIIIQLQNSNSEPQTAWEDITFDIHSSSQTGEFSLSKDEWAPVTQLIIAQGSQQATLYYKDTVAGKPMINIKEVPNRGWEEAIQQLNVVGLNQMFEVSVISPQVAGREFSAQITAKDDSGNVDKFFNTGVDIAAIYISPSSGTKLITPDNATIFTNGVANVALTYADCGIIEIAVNDKAAPEKSGKSGPVIFVPDKFSMTASAISQIVAKPFPMTVSALTVDGTAAPNYQGPAALQAVAVNPPIAAGGAISPSQLESAQFVNGVAQIQASYNLWGTISIQAHDQISPDQRGSIPTIYFAPGSITAKANVPPAGRDFFYTGEQFLVTVSVFDALGTVISNFQQEVVIHTDPNFEGLDDVYLFMPQDSGVKTFALSTQTPGSYVFKFQTSDGLTAQTEPVKVEQATIQVIPTVAPIGKTQVEIQLLDSQGKRILSDSTLPLTITFDESSANGSVFLDSPGKPVLFHNGVAKIVLGDTEAETVTINPQSTYNFKIQSGTVTFGKVGKSGIGTLLYWEDKDDAKNEKK